MEQFDNIIQQVEKGGLRIPGDQGGAKSRGQGSNPECGNSCGFHTCTCVVRDTRRQKQTQRERERLILSSVQCKVIHCFREGSDMTIS